MLIFILGPSGLSYQFSVIDRYSAGQAVVLSKGEARALNLMRAENVTRNKAKRVRSAENMTPDKIIGDWELECIQGEIAEYDGRYQFADEVEANGRMGDLEREAIEASLVIGHEPRHPKCRAEARLRLIAKRGVAKQALEAL